MGQKAFYFDMSRCVGCHACQVACRDRNALYNVGEIFRKVDSYEGGKFPKPWVYFLSIACNHCAKPACVANCPTGAMYKDPDTGLVLHDDELCIGCGTCVQACPYHEPILMEKEGKTVSAKCDGCYALVKEGKNPVCVDACNMRVLRTPCRTSKSCRMPWRRFRPSSSTRLPKQWKRSRHKSSDLRCRSFGKTCINNHYKSETPCPGLNTGQGVFTRMTLTLVF